MNFGKRRGGGREREESIIVFLLLLRRTRTDFVQKTCGIDNIIEVKKQAKGKIIFKYVP